MRDKFMINFWTDQSDRNTGSWKIIEIIVKTSLVSLVLKVLCVEKTKDHDTTGRWSVLVRNQDGTESESVFDAVMVCTSIFNKPFVPTYPGMDVFQGEICHSKEFRKGERFKDKTVLAVGTFILALYIIHV